MQGHCQGGFTVEIEFLSRFLLRTSVVLKKVVLGNNGRIIQLLKTLCSVLVFFGFFFLQEGGGKRAKLRHLYNQHFRTVTLFEGNRILVDDSSSARQQ